MDVYPLCIDIYIYVYSSIHFTILETGAVCVCVCRSWLVLTVTSPFVRIDDDANCRLIFDSFLLFLVIIFLFHFILVERCICIVGYIVCIRMGAAYLNDTTMHFFVYVCTQKSRYMLLFSFQKESNIQTFAIDTSFSPPSRPPGKLPHFLCSVSEEVTGRNRRRGAGHGTRKENSFGARKLLLPSFCILLNRSFSSRLLQSKGRGKQNMGRRRKKRPMKFELKISLSVCVVSITQRQF